MMVLHPASTNGYDTSDKTETKTEKLIHNIFRIPEELEFTRVAQFPVRPILWNQIPSNNTISSAMKRLILARLSVFLHGLEIEVDVHFLALVSIQGAWYNECMLRKKNLKKLSQIPAL